MVLVHFLVQYLKKIAKPKVKTEIVDSKPKEIVKPKIAKPKEIAKPKIAKPKEIVKKAKPNGSRKVVKHGQANSRKDVEKKVKGVEMKATKKKKPMHENLYPGGWSDAVMMTGHHISQVE